MPLPVATPRTILTTVVGWINEFVVFLAGKSGGSIIYGGTDANDDLELQSTSHATKGNINLATTFYVDDTNNRVYGDGFLSMYGGLGSGEDLIIGSTAHATKGDIILDSIFTFDKGGNSFKIFNDANVVVKVALQNDTTQWWFAVDAAGDFIFHNRSAVKSPLKITDAALEDMLFIDNESIGINTASPHAKALIDFTSTLKGVLFPRMNTTQKNAISAPPAGLTIYDTDDKKLETYDGTTWQAHW